MKTLSLVVLSAVFVAQSAQAWFVDLGVTPGGDGVIVIGPGDGSSRDRGYQNGSDYDPRWDRRDDGNWDRRDDQSWGRGSGGDLRIGSTVYTRGGSRGTIRGVFGDGALSVEINGSLYNKRRSELAVEGCVRDQRLRLCTGETLYTPGGSVGRMTAVFENTEILVEINGSLYVKSPGDLAVRGCQGSFCTNDAVITRGGSTGRVMGIFRNGDLMVEINGSLYRKSPADLAGSGGVTRPLPGGISVGQQVYTRGGSRGTVRGVFQNGDISVEINGSLYNKDINDLAVEGCLTREFCTGDGVLTVGGSYGTIRAIFRSGELMVEINGSLYVKNARDLARTR